MSYHEHLRQERRLVILRLLAETPGYQANAAIIGGLLQRMGVPASRDQVHTELDWLAEQGLVTVEDLGAVRVAVVSARGVDVANGLAIVPGVHRPSPR